MDPCPTQRTCNSACRIPKRATTWTLRTRWLKPGVTTLLARRSARHLVSRVSNDDNEPPGGSVSFRHVTTITIPQHRSEAQHTACRTWTGEGHIYEWHYSGALAAICFAHTSRWVDETLTDFITITQFSCLHQARTPCEVKYLPPCCTVGWRKRPENTLARLDWRCPRRGQRHLHDAGRQRVLWCIPISSHRST